MNCDCVFQLFVLLSLFYTGYFVYAQRSSSQYQREYQFPRRYDPYRYGQDLVNRTLVRTVTSSRDGGPPQTTRQVLYNYTGPFNRNILPDSESVTEIEDDDEYQPPVGIWTPPYEATDTVHPFVRYGYSENCTASACTPPTGDLLIGRAKNLTATSTCGLYKEEKYCILSPIGDSNPTRRERNQKCYTCDSRTGASKSPARYHRIENVITKPGEDYKTYWWQAENGVQDVSIQVDFGYTFHFTHVIMTFQTFRPAAMLIERSKDGGRTWKVYQYFSAKCELDFPGVPLGPRQALTDVICESQYSNELPSYHGDLIFKLLSPNIPIRDPYSDEVQDLLKMTNFRINFTRLHTFGDNLLDPRKEIRQKYYYAIMNMKIRGSCFCNGHAGRCVPADDSAYSYERDMIYGICECQHNTKGIYCTECEDFYHDAPWKPAIGAEFNPCKRCNCNNHATKCKFDMERWLQSGNKTGGVCLDCADNTMGPNCDQCKSKFYRDPIRRPDDPYVCVACDCDPRGSLDDGVCDSSDDPNNAGQCHCKTNVGGRRCDQCKPGFWKFDENNPLGCQECGCNINGTLGNLGCDTVTGKCTCKPHVTGQNCDQCEANYYGFGPQIEGCYFCDCDPGGSYSPQCNVTTGECPCRIHATGRRCNEIESGYFTPMLDHKTYDAEMASHSSEAQNLLMTPYPGQKNTWTGEGFLKIYQGSSIDYDISDVPRSGHYDIIIRHMPPEPFFTPQAEIRVESLSGPPPPQSPCLQDSTNFVQNRRSFEFKADRPYTKIVGGPFCFDRNYRYKIHLQAGSRSYGTGNNASIAIDSIVLTPVIDEMEFFKSNQALLDEFRRYGCGDVFNSIIKPDMPPVCHDLYRSISLLMYNGALNCKCNSDGSESTKCEVEGGQCKCRPNVIGRTCDRCAPRHFGFGPEGCTFCDCHPTGSMDPVCDVVTGNCKCIANTYGRRCDECQPGFWNYPNCRRCECNGHAETCDSKTGVCINCLHSTAGDHCERCANGFYGNPIFGSDVPCQPCPCPGTPGSTSYHADSCDYDPREKVPVCRCKEGYSGSRCEQCAENFYGDPTLPGGECRSCQCNDNIDLNSKGNCDSRTGTCLKCLHNTEGDHCEVCRKGYYGNALKKSCSECICNALGTNKTEGKIPENDDTSGLLVALPLPPGAFLCDQESGNCPCLPNVVGRECDKCAPNHFNLSSGLGCEACNCDAQGSFNLRCNEYDGQCQCKPGHGGRRCNECQPNYYGDPRLQCYACECNPLGSISMQCNKVDGTCQCVKGISGKKCDQCARGYIGTAPSCESCGECFENWDLIIQQLKDDTLRLMENARKIRQTGAPGAYKNSFINIENHLLDLSVALSGANSSQIEIDALRREIEVLKRTLAEIQEELKKADTDVTDTLNRNAQSTIKLNDLQRKAQEIDQLKEQLRENSTKLRADDIMGAYNLTEEASRQSKIVNMNVEKDLQQLARSAELRHKTERLLQQNALEYEKSIQDNQGSLENTITKRIKDLEDQIPNINLLLCGSHLSTVDKCDFTCGGAGCSKCGGLGCNGSTTQAEDALDFAQKADLKLKSLQEKSDAKLREIGEARARSEEAVREAQKAYNAAMRARNNSESMAAEIQELFRVIDNFLNQNAAKPGEIKALAEECLKIQISLTPDQITDLANQINATLKNVQDIEKILSETEGDLRTAEMLEQNANYTKARADDVLNTARQVQDALNTAEQSQNQAENAIKGANDKILGAQADLDDIQLHISYIENNTKSYQDAINNMRDRMINIQNKYTNFQYLVQRASDEAGSAGEMAREAERDAKKLEDVFKQVRNTLNSKETQSGAIKDKSEGLKSRAIKLAQNAQDKIHLLQGIEDQFKENEKQLELYAVEIGDLNRQALEYLTVIEERSNFHKTCQV